MLIETDEITLELYQRELVKSFIVFGFTEIHKALETMAQRDIRAVVIEPEINAGQGWEFIRSIRANLPERALPVIVCSTRDASSTNRIAHISAYLTKPVSPRTLREKTLAVLRQQDR